MTALFLPLDTADAAGVEKPGECRSAPKGAPPQGERWYYRVERGTKRHCWYTRTNTGSPRKFVEKSAQPPIAAKADDAPPLLQPAVANARAEAEQWPPPQSSAAGAPRAAAGLGDGESRTWKMAERWADRPEPPAPEPQPAVRLMRLQTVASEPPVVAEGSAMQRLVDALGGALAILGIGTVLIAVLRQRKQPDEEDIGLPPLTDGDGRPSASWYEPPLDRLRMARHLAELPRPAM